MFSKFLKTTALLALLLTPLISYGTQAVGTLGTPDLSLGGVRFSQPITGDIIYLGFYVEGASRYDTARKIVDSAGSSVPTGKVWTARAIFLACKTAGADRIRLLVTSTTINNAVGPPTIVNTLFNGSAGNTDRAGVLSLGGIGDAGFNWTGPTPPMTAAADEFFTMFLATATPCGGYLIVEETDA